MSDVALSTACFVTSQACLSPKAAFELNACSKVVPFKASRVLLVPCSAGFGFVVLSSERRRLKSATSAWGSQAGDLPNGSGQVSEMIFRVSLRSVGHDPGFPNSR